LLGQAGKEVEVTRGKGAVGNGLRIARCIVACLVLRALCPEIWCCFVVLERCVNGGVSSFLGRVGIYNEKSVIWMLHSEYIEWKGKCSDCSKSCNAVVYSDDLIT
jgi:hypothetical protein